MAKVWRNAARYVFAAGCVGAAYTSAANANGLNLSYSIEILGVEVYKVHLNADIAPGGYAMSVRMEPAGVVGVFSGGKMVASGNGRISNNSVRMRTYQMTGSSRFGSDKTVTLSMRNGRLEAQRDFDIDGNDDAAIKKAVTQGTRDAFSLLTRHMLLSGPKSCAGNGSVYSGWAVYAYSLKYAGEKQVKSAASGKTYAQFTCQLSYRRVAGAGSGAFKAFQESRPKPISVNYAQVKVNGREVQIPMSARTTIRGQSISLSLLKSSAMP
ncbi:MAG: DUF3108 domain-containing protein [Hyphomicrobiales bacterium]